MLSKPCAHLSSILSLVAAVATTPTAFAHTFAGHQYLSQASVSVKTARATALKTYPGRIASEELEREHGGSGLRYSFDIRHAGVTHEVGIDAKTGRVLENSKEGPDSD